MRHRAITFAVSPREYRLAAVLAAAVLLVSGVAYAGKRLALKRADRTAYTVGGSSDTVVRVTVTHFNGGGRCRAWLKGGGTQKDLNGEGVYVEVLGGSRISILTCDECKNSTNSCKEGSPVGEWPITTNDNNPVVEATWEIGAGIRGVGQATAVAHEAD
jgi:hypothetical protein